MAFPFSMPNIAHLAAGFKSQTSHCPAFLIFHKADTAAAAYIAGKKIPITK